MSLKHDNVAVNLTSTSGVQYGGDEAGDRRAQEAEGSPGAEGEAGQYQYQYQYQYQKEGITNKKVREGLRAIDSKKKEACEQLNHTAYHGNYGGRTAINL